MYVDGVATGDQRVRRLLAADLGARLPVVAAPMAGGASTPALVDAAAQSGALGFLAGGYLTATQLAESIDDVARRTERFGVNLFVPNPVPISPAELHRYAQRVDAVAGELGLGCPTLEPGQVDDDDHWDAKVALLTDVAPPVASFTFGPVPRPVVRRLQRRGTLVVQTVTSLDEARAATDRGVDGLVVQGNEGGGHYATWTPRRARLQPALPELVRQVAALTGRPVWAAGGVVRPDQVTALLAAGAEGVCVGTALLRTPESGASPTHKTALATLGDRPTVLTKAFTGRAARAVRNAFTDHLDPVAPDGYPALHHLTAPLRRAAATGGQAELLHLWAGVGFPHIDDEPAAQVLRRLGGAA